MEGGEGNFFGFVGNPRDFGWVLVFGFFYPHQFNHPLHLESGVPLVVIQYLTHPTDGILCVPFAVLFRRKSHTQVIVRSRCLLMAS